MKKNIRMKLIDVIALLVMMQSQMDNRYGTLHSAIHLKSLVILNIESGKV